MHSDNSIFYFVALLYVSYWLLFDVWYESQWNNKALYSLQDQQLAEHVSEAENGAERVENRFERAAKQWAGFKKSSGAERER